MPELQITELTNKLKESEGYTREEVFDLLKESLVELTDNRGEDIREESLIYDELNLTEYDLQRLIKQIGTQVEINVDEMLKEAADEEVHTIADLLDLIIDEKDLG